MSSTLMTARMFLARAMAWPQEGEPLAYVNIHQTFIPTDITTLKKHPDGTPKYPWTGRAARSLEEAVKSIEFGNNSQNTRDIYYCTSTQSYAEAKTSQRGFSYLKPVRASANAVKHKTLFLDIDLKGGDHGYDTEQELFTSLVEFLRATGMPRPTFIVASGGGFHIYWTLQEAVTTDKWLPMAYALAEATKRHGLKCDTQCTIDAARVLRVPQTKNFKYDPPREVKMYGSTLEFDYLNSKLETVLAPYKVAVPFSVANANMSILPPKAPIQGLSDLAGGIDLSGSAPVKLDTLVHECGFVAEALATGGAAFQNPLWNLTTLIATFTEGGRADAHRMASGHPGYGPGETDELFDRKVAEKLTKNIGWPQCSSISASGCTSCATCPHFPANKSPLNYGQKVTTLVTGATSQTPTGPQGAPQASVQGQGGTTLAQTPQTPPQPMLVVPGTGQADPDLPKGYLRNAQGLVLYAQSLDDGTTTWMPITSYPMSDPWMQREPWSLNFTTTTEFNKRSQICVPLKDVGTGEMKKTLQDQGFMVGGGTRGFNLLAEFIMAWITKLQATKDMIISSVPYGWLVRHGKTAGFVYGGSLHTPTGKEVAANTDPELSRQFSPVGEMQSWIDAAQIITDQKRPALDAILASAFGAPLVRFTGHAGLLMSAYSIESGIGKSTALKIAQAVWGDPVKGVQGLSDTQNSVFNKLGELRSLPIYWDELKSQEDTKRFVDLTFRLSSGKEKSRMTSKVTQRATGTWQTIMVSASNESLVDAVTYATRATTAGLYRVFEFPVKAPMPGAPGQIDPTVAQRMIAKLHDNYGNVGWEYASYLGGNFAQVEADMGTMVSNIGKEVGMANDERFWIALIASILLGARYANALGYTNIDEAGLKAFMYSSLQEMRGLRNSQPVDMRNVVNVVNTLGRFINENRSRHMLVTSTIHRTRGKPAAGAVTVIGDHSRLEAIHIHVGVNDRTMRIGQSYLADWLTQHNYPRHVFMKALQEELKANTISARLGAGTSFANASEYLIEIDISGTPLINFLDEA